MEITGVMVNYYIHCKRQCYLFSNRINMEDNEEAVHIGKAIHEDRMKKHRKVEIQLDSIKIDRLTKEYLTEVKKSDSDVEAARWQMYYYLYILNTYGIKRKGKLEFVEKNQNNQAVKEELTPEVIVKIEKILKEIQELIAGENVPKERLSKNECKKCAYYAYCYI